MRIRLDTEQFEMLQGAKRKDTHYLSRLYWNL
jgi:hypothetical protein